MTRNNLRLVFLFLVTSLNILSAQQKIKPGWETEFEKSGYTRTQRYKETMEYFRKIEKASPYVRIIPFGKSPQGRDLYVVIISKDKAFTPGKAKKTGKPVFVINNGIHSGEIEGKDATMLLLREILITKEQQQLLDKITLLVIPVFSVDGHERFSANNRINQNGPVEMGWRTTAQNLNLNRDWVKADAPEMQAMLKLMTAWLPDYFIDCHTTDGADFQYAANYGLEKFQNMYQSSAAEITANLVPYLTKRCEEKGFYIAPYVGFKDGDFTKGITDWPGSPRFSTGYFAAQNRIALLIETHMLKPYKTRVFATKALLEASLEYVANNATKLINLNKIADEQSMRDFCISGKYFPLQFAMNKTTSSSFFWRGYKHVTDSSIVSGGKKIVYTEEKSEAAVPYYNEATVTDSVQVPFAYIIPAEYAELANRLKLHGVHVRTTTREQKLTVSRYHFKEVKFNNSPYEGRHPVTASYTVSSDTIVVPAGCFIVETRQRTVRLIVTALEPKSPDSFVRWGFMNAIFEQKEYFEDYVMEKVALEMLDKDKVLTAEFYEKVKTDSVFAGNQGKRLNYFYERSPYYDKNLNLYPIFRVENKTNLL